MVPHWAIVAGSGTVVLTVGLYRFLRLFVQMRVHKLVTTHVLAYPETPEQYGLAYESVRFRTTDDVWLAGWIAFPRREEPRGLVVLLHGFGGPGHTGGKSRQLPWIAALVKSGYMVFTFDFRNHGESENASFTFGHDELLDVAAAHQFLMRSAFLCEFPMVLAGVSFGAATAIRFAATYPHRFCGVLAISGYADFPQLIREGVRRNYGFLGHFPGLPEMILEALAAELSGVSLDELSPASVVASIAPTPLFIMHGAQDDLVSDQHAKALFAAAQHPKSYAYILGGSHGFLLSPVASQEAAVRARATAIRFLDRVVNNYSPHEAGSRVIIKRLTRGIECATLAVESSLC